VIVQHIGPHYVVLIVLYKKKK